MIFTTPTGLKVQILLHIGYDIWTFRALLAWLKSLLDRALKIGVHAVMFLPNFHRGVSHFFPENFGQAYCTVLCMRVLFYYTIALLFSVSCFSERE